MLSSRSSTIKFVSYEFLWCLSCDRAFFQLCLGSLMLSVSSSSDLAHFLLWLRCWHWLNSHHALLLVRSICYEVPWDDSCCASLRSPCFHDLPPVSPQCVVGATRAHKLNQSWWWSVKLSLFCSILEKPQISSVLSTSHMYHTQHDVVLLRVHWISVISLHLVYESCSVLQPH